MIGISGSLIWSKSLMDLIFNPCGEFRWSPDDRVRQIQSPHLDVGAPGIFSDGLRSVQMINRKWDAESNGKLPHLFNHWFLSLQWKTCLRQNCSLGSCACSEGPALGQNTLMNEFKVVYRYHSKVDYLIITQYRTKTLIRV